MEIAHVGSFLLIILFIIAYSLLGDGIVALVEFVSDYISGKSRKNTHLKSNNKTITDKGSEFQRQKNMLQEKQEQRRKTIDMDTDLTDELLRQTKNIKRRKYVVTEHELTDNKTNVQTTGSGYLNKRRMLKETQELRRKAIDMNTDLTDECQTSRKRTFGQQGKEWREKLKYLLVNKVISETIYNSGIKSLEYYVKKGYTDADFKNYPNDWKKITRQHRRKKNYKCEICGTYLKGEITDNNRLKDKSELLNLHHINRIKPDCRPSNLILLCLACHAEQGIDHEQLAFREEYGLSFEYRKSHKDEQDRQARQDRIKKLDETRKKLLQTRKTNNHPPP